MVRVPRRKTIRRSGWPREENWNYICRPPHLRHAQRAAGACNLADGSEASGLGGGEEIDLVFGCQQPLPGLDQRSRSASAGCVRDCADEPTVKETVLLRQLAAEIRGDHASAGGDLFHPGIDVTQEALAREGVFNPFHIVRVAYCQC